MQLKDSSSAEISKNMGLTMATGSGDGTVAFVLQVLALYSCLSGTSLTAGMWQANRDALTCGCFLILGFWDTWVLDNRFFSQDDTQLFSEAYCLTHSAGGEGLTKAQIGFETHWGCGPVLSIGLPSFPLGATVSSPTLGSCATEAPLHHILLSFSFWFFLAFFHFFVGFFLRKLFLYVCLLPVHTLAASICYLPRSPHSYHQLFVSSVMLTDRMSL